MSNSSSSSTASMANSCVEIFAPCNCAEWMNFPELISIMLQSFDWLRSKTMWNCEIKFYWISITFGALSYLLFRSEIWMNEWMQEEKRESSLEKYHHITQIKLKACHKKMKPLFNIETYYHRLEKQAIRYNITVFCGQCKSIIFSYLIAQLQAPLFDSHIHSYDA